MPRRGEIINRATNDYVSVQVYDPAAGDPPSPATLFEKWALVEVSAADSMPDGMRQYSLTGGKFAVFLHKGPASDYAKSMQYIVGEWLPNSGSELDQRKHFEILPQGYDPVDPDAKEEIWIPIRQISQRPT